jgi:hypothetical protein
MSTDHGDSNRDRRNDPDEAGFDPRPESAMGGAADAGAEGHPASAMNLDEEGIPVLPDEALGDAPIERRHQTDHAYGGPERRLARR